jgi:lipoprotein-anchoring transpeptidase ErfK/SrfK
VAPAISHSHLAVAAFVAAIAKQVGKPARDARIKITLRHIYRQRSRPGRGLDVAAATKAIDAAIDDPAAPRVLHEPLTRVRAKINANDLARVYNTVITIDKAQFRLRLFKGLKFRKSYGVAVGQPAYPTPSGRFAIQSKQVNPTWSVPNSPWAGELQGTTVEGGSAANPLKARWMGIANGVGIHGTGEDWSIGTRASHGCIRMHVADVIDLYNRVPIGTPVLIQ